MGRLRIIGGRFKGRQLEAPTGRGTRPTTDRVREALFNILEHMDPSVLPGAVVLDLFAGTGALGLEALSRGADRCLFVDDDRTAIAAISKNAQSLDLEDVVEIIRGDARRLGRAKATATLVFADAPYCRGLIGPALTNALDKGWLAAGAMVVLEVDGDEDIDLAPAFNEMEARTYGGTKIVFFSLAACSPR